MDGTRRYKMLPTRAADEEILLAGGDGDDGLEDDDNDDHVHYAATKSSSAIMGDGDAPAARKSIGIRRLQSDSNSHVYQRISLANGGSKRTLIQQQPFYMKYNSKAHRWYFRPTFIFVISIFLTTLTALLFLKSVSIRKTTTTTTDFDSLLNFAHVVSTSHAINIPDADDLQLRPTVANGQLGYVIGSNQLSVAGVYNGAKHASKIARIPVPIEISIDSPSNKSLWQETGRFHSLDTLNGLYSEVITLKNLIFGHSANVTKFVYVHRVLPDLFMIELLMTSEVSTDVVDVPIKYTTPDWQKLSSEDVEFQPTERSDAVFGFLPTCTARGRTRQAEFPDDTTLTRDIVLMWACGSRLLNNTSADDIKYLWTGAPDVYMLAVGNDLTRINRTYYHHQQEVRWLSTLHRAAWHALWSSSNITLISNISNTLNPSTMSRSPPKQQHQMMKRHGDGPESDHDDEPPPAAVMSIDADYIRLAKVLNTAQYYLWSEVPFDFFPSSSMTTTTLKSDNADDDVKYVSHFHGIPRSGLAHAATSPSSAANSFFSGHVYWDQEMYMLPMLTAMQPKMAEQVLASRVRLLAAARQNARAVSTKSNSKNVGARYPYESGSSGREISTDDEQQHLVAERSMHVSCDISAALSTYVRSGGDVANIVVADVIVGDKRKLSAMDMALDIATFYADRLVCGSNHVRRRRHGDDEAEEADEHAVENRVSLITSGNAGGVLAAAAADKNACHLYNVMGPDQNHSPVNDSYYTNACVVQALLTPSLLCNRTGEIIVSSSSTTSTLPAVCSTPDAESMLSKFELLARRIYLPLQKFNESWFYHPEFVGYNPSSSSVATAARKGSQISQADVVLVAHPLGYRNGSSFDDDEFNSQLRWHDLSLYDAVVNQRQPLAGGMLTLPMHVVGFREFSLQPDARALADKYFQQQLEYIRGPFFKWFENARQNDADNKNSGAVNFMPAVGGFLQSIVNGYAGLRYERGRHMILDAGLLPHNVEFALNGFHYHGLQFNLRVLRRAPPPQSMQQHGHRMKRHGDDAEESEPQKPQQKMSTGVFVELTWHKPRSFSFLIKDWVRHLLTGDVLLRAFVNPQGSDERRSVVTEAPTKTTGVDIADHLNNVFGSKESGGDDEDNFAVHKTVRVCQQQNSSSMLEHRIRRHGDDEDEEMEQHAASSGKSAPNTDVEKHDGLQCQELLESDRVYTFDAANGRLIVQVV